MIFGWTAWPILFDERLQKLCKLSLVLPRQHGELRQYSVPHRVEPAALIPAIGFRRIRDHLSGIYALAKSRFHHGSGARFHIVPLPFLPQIIMERAISASILTNQLFRRGTGAARDTKTLEFRYTA